MIQLYKGNTCRHLHDSYTISGRDSHALIISGYYNIPQMHEGVYKMIEIIFSSHFNDGIIWH